MILQRSEEWQEARLGSLTGSRAHALMSSSTTTLMSELVMETVIASKKRFKPTASMQRGIDDEDQAISYYELVNGVAVVRDRYIVSDFHPLCAGSPDGLVGEDGGLEVKCLAPANHVKILLSGKSEAKYRSQIEWYMLITGKKWWDYYGYCKELPEPLTTFTLRIERDEERMGEMRERALKFLGKLDAHLEKLGFAL